MTAPELPEWVWQLLELTQKYGEEHPKLWRDNGPAEWTAVECLDSQIQELVPPEIWQAAEIMRSRARREAALIVGCGKPHPVERYGYVQCLRAAGHDRFHNNGNLEWA